MENKTNGVSQEGCQCTGESFKEKMIRKVLESKALQTVLDFMVGGKSIASNTDANISIDIDMDGVEFAERTEYNDNDKETLQSITANGKIKMQVHISGKGTYSLERK